MTQIKKALKGAILAFDALQSIGKLANKTKLLNRAELALNSLKRAFTGESAAEHQLNRFARKGILQLKGSWWMPTQKMREANLEKTKLSIRDARAMRSVASKAELKYMQENPDKATKVYKSGAREFGGVENKLALTKVRLEAMSPYIKDLTHSFKWQGKRLAKSPLYNSKTGKISKKKLAAWGILGVPAYNIATNNIYDNVFPFGYYDARDDDPTNPKSLKATGKFFKKFIPGAYGKTSDARKVFDKIASLDLNDPQLRKLAIEMYKNNPVVRTPLGINTNIDYVQKIFRARTDLNNLHAGRKLQYNSFIPNKEYLSNASKKNPNLTTWIPADKLLREEYRRLGRAYNLLQGDVPEGLEYSLSGVSDNNGMYGGMSIIKNHNDGSGKYIDEWDFVGDEILLPLGLSKRVIVADTIPANTKPSKYHNFGKESSVRITK